MHNRIVWFINNVLLHNGRLSYTDGHLFVLDGEIPLVIQGEKVSLKEIFAKVFQTKSNSLVSAPFLAVIFCGKRKSNKELPHIII